MTKHLSFLCFFFFVSCSSFSQEISSFISEFGFGSSLLDSGTDIAFDSDGNILIYGFFDEDADFDLTADEMILSPLGSPDLFLAKYSNSGELDWVINLGRIGLIDGVLNGEMAIDSDDNIIVSGSFTSTVNFNPLGESAANTAEGAEDAFIAKYSPEGELSWFNKIGGISTDIGTALAVNADNSLALGLRFTGNIDVDPGDNEVILTNDGATDAAVVKFDENGNYSSSLKIASPENDNITEISFAPDGKIAIGSTVNGAVNGLPDRNMQLSFHQPDGTLLWIHNFSNYDDANEISEILFSQVDLSLFVGGRINGTTDFNPELDAEEIIDPVFADPFIAKYNLSGELDWAKNISSSGTNDYLSGMALAGSTLFTLGAFDIEATFVSGDLSTQRQSVGGQDLFIAAYDFESGNFTDADVYGGVGDEFARSSFFQDAGTLLCTGSYTNGLNLDPEGESIANLGFTDVFFAEFSFQTDLSDELDQSALDRAKVFPNPVSEIMYVQMPKSIPDNQLEYKIINVVGQDVKRGNVNLDIESFKIDVSDLTKGVFILELISGTQKVSKRIVKH